MGKIYKGLAFDGQIDVAIIDSTDIVEEAIRLHSLSPLAAAALGRSMTAVCFMATNLKNAGDNLSVTIDGNGAGGQIVVCADSKLNIRGYIDNPSVYLPLNAAGKLDVGGCVGKNGKITVVKNMGLKEPYTGCSRLVSGELAEDFSAYYTYSEQQPTGMALGVKIGKDLHCAGAGGVVFQAMPGATDEAITKAEEMLSHFSNISSMIETGGATGVLDGYFPDGFFVEYEPKYHCTCSKDYVDRVLITLGEKELYDCVEKEGKIEVSCHFCDKKYVYSKSDVDKLLGKANGND